MATLPTPNALALEVIRHLVRGAARPGTGTTLPALRSAFGDHRPADDFRAALTFAVDARWIELQRDGNSVILTAEGFAAA